MPYNGKARAVPKRNLIIEADNIAKAKAASLRPQSAPGHQGSSSAWGESQAPLPGCTATEDGRPSRLGDIQEQHHVQVAEFVSGFMNESAEMS